MAPTATMPNDTAIGTFRTTNAKTAPNSRSMMAIALRSWSYWIRSDNDSSASGAAGFLATSRSIRYEPSATTIDDAERYFHSKDNHQGDNAPLEQAAIDAAKAVYRGACGRDRRSWHRGGYKLATGSSRSLPQRNCTVDQLFGARNFLAEFLVDGLAGGDQSILDQFVDLHTRLL